MDQNLTTCDLSAPCLIRLLAAFAVGSKVIGGQLCNMATISERDGCDIHEHLRPHGVDVHPYM